MTEMNHSLEQKINQLKDTMKNDYTNDYIALHTAALTLSTKMLASLPQAEIDALERATKQGGKLVLELGPLPDCQRIELTLLEREGARHIVASLGASHD